MNEDIRGAKEEIRAAARGIQREVDEAVSRRRQKHDRRDDRRQAWWGVFIVALGLYFLVGQFDFNVPSLSELWPAFVIGFGLVRLLNWRHTGDVESGTFFILIGLWLLACELYWWGFTYSGSWPVAIVILGFTMILRALLERGRRSRAGGES